MSDQPENPEETRDDASGGGPRMRFKAIVEAARARDGAPYGVLTIERDEKRWNAISRQVFLASQLVAVFVFFSFLIGPPLGSYLAQLKLYGAATWPITLSAYGTETVLFAFIVPVLILLIGYAVSRMATMMNAAESIAAAAQQYVTPDVTAAHNADAVGEVVRGHMAALNEGLDGALTRLASVESMIRQHVEAIELAGEAIEHHTTGAVTRVADERSRLMELTESLNAHADQFAAAIAERAKASIEALQSADRISDRAEQDFDERLNRLESAAHRAVESFDSLRTALLETTEQFAASSQSIDEAARSTEAATDRANAAAAAAADSAARNAANVSASAERAMETSRKAADAAIAAASSDAERIAASALEAAAEQAERIKASTRDMLGEVSGEALESARTHAEKATKAASDVAAAAKAAGEAAQQASSDVSAAGEQARKSSEDAVALSQSAAARIDERNKALAEARAALEKENQRLEALIEEQRQRADRLAEAIASQTDRLTRLAEDQLREQEEAARLAEARRENEARAAAENAAAEERRRKEAAEARRREEKRAAETEARRPAEHPAPRPQPPGEPAAPSKGAAGKPAPSPEPEGRKTAPPERPAGPAPRQANPNPHPEPKHASPPAAGRSDAERDAARLDELARDIAERRPREEKRKKSIPERIGSAARGAKSKPKNKGNISWREILDAADDAEPLELGAASKPDDAAANAIRIIAELQDFTNELETRLYGEPPPALQERYRRGDRNVFANRLLRLNEADVKRRIRSESARDREFEQRVHQFLQGFERLLEDATTSETADEELEEYLSSPLGRVYLLIGATVGYFA